MEEPELTEQQKTALRKAIGDIVGDYAPWVLIVDITTLGETNMALSQSVTDTHSSAFTINDAARSRSKVRGRIVEAGSIARRKALAQETHTQ